MGFPGTHHTFDGLVDGFGDFAVLGGQMRGFRGGPMGGFSQRFAKRDFASQHGGPDAKKTRQNMARALGNMEDLGKARPDRRFRVASFGDDQAR